MSEIDGPLLKKLCKLLTLMLSSDKDGEVISSARAARRVLESHKMDIHALTDLLNADLIHSAWEDGIEEGRQQERKEMSQPVEDDDIPLSLHEMAKFCAARGKRMTEKQQGFIKNMVAWTVNGGTISEKQEVYLSDLYNDLQRKG